MQIASQLVRAWHHASVREHPREIYSGVRSKKSISSLMPVLVLAVVAVATIVALLTVVWGNDRSVDRLHRLSQAHHPLVKAEVMAATTSLTLAIAQARTVDG